MPYAALSRNARPLCQQGFWIWGQIQQLETEAFKAKPVGLLAFKRNPTGLLLFKPNPMGLFAFKPNPAGLFLFKQKRA